MSDGLKLEVASYFGALLDGKFWRRERVLLFRCVAGIVEALYPLIFKIGLTKARWL